MSLLQAAFDVLLAGTLTVLAWRMLFGRDLFASSVAFVTFGLAMALVWARLRAPDIALAEAAVGAGLTGALLLRAAGRMGESFDRRRLPALAVPILVGTVAAGVGLLRIMNALRWPRPGLAQEARRAADAMGVEQPVTAVLLVFRGYDTWLELAVLLVAVVAVLGTTALPQRPPAPPPDPLLNAFVRLLAPAAVVAAGLMVWLGTTAPGGAFQGGAVAAAMLVLAYRPGMRWFRRVRGPLGRATLLVGFALPLLLTVPNLVRGGALFAYPDDPGGWMLLVEVAVAFAVTLTLASLFVAADVDEARDGEA